jgi:hypothetical protein
MGKKLLTAPPSAPWQEFVLVTLLPRGHNHCKRLPPRRHKFQVHRGQAFPLIGTEKGGREAQAQYHDQVPTPYRKSVQDAASHRPTYLNMLIAPARSGAKAFLGCPATSVSRSRAILPCPGANIQILKSAAAL